MFWLLTLTTIAIGFLKLSEYKLEIFNLQTENRKLKNLIESKDFSLELLEKSNERLLSLISKQSKNIAKLLDENLSLETELSYKD